MNDRVAVDALAVHALGVRKEFRRGEQRVVAVDGVDLAVPSGSLVAVHGRSGSGKTTLLNLLCGLERLDGGRLVVAGHDLAALDETELAEFRRRELGFVFQNFGLVDVLSARENVDLVLRSDGLEVGERARRADDALARLGLADRADHLPDELSGGERQRVAIARALVRDTPLLLADEPTGQLDRVTAGVVAASIRSVVDDRNVAAIVSTHDPSLIEMADIRLQLADGVMV